MITYSSIRSKLEVAFDPMLAKSKMGVKVQSVSIVLAVELKIGDPNLRIPLGRNKLRVEKAVTGATSKLTWRRRPWRFIVDLFVSLPEIIMNAFQSPQFSVERFDSVTESVIISCHHFHVSKDDAFVDVRYCCSDQFSNNRVEIKYLANAGPFVLKKQ